jgi:hypothetical protein
MGCFETGSHCKTNHAKEKHTEAVRSVEKGKGMAEPADENGGHTGNGLPSLYLDAFLDTDSSGFEHGLLRDRVPLLCG